MPPIPPAFFDDVQAQFRADFLTRDASDLAEKIDRALTDEEFRQRCREEVKPLLESYAWDTLADETADLYADVIERRHSFSLLTRSR